MFISTICYDDDDDDSSRLATHLLKFLDVLNQLFYKLKWLICNLFFSSANWTHSIAYVTKVQLPREDSNHKLDEGNQKITPILSLTFQVTTKLLQVTKSTWHIVKNI